MATGLDLTFQAWLDGVAAEHAAVLNKELKNRFDVYPAVQECLTSRPIDTVRLRMRTRKAAVTAITKLEKFASTGLKTLLDDSPEASHQLAQLIDYLPETSAEMIDRIDEFVALGKARGGIRPGQVLSVAALVLSVAHPSVFVDCPSHFSWTQFAQTLGYGVLNTKATPGEILMWASTFGQMLAETDSFKRRWPHEAARALWVISALNWTHRLTSVKGTA